jgi:hypothetical protein
LRKARSEGAYPNEIGDETLEIVGMQRKGKNAADFGLAFHGGRLLAELPPDTEFVIVSKDAGLDHVVDLLRRAGRTSRVPGDSVDGCEIGAPVGIRRSPESGSSLWEARRARESWQPCASS